jgi:hypothetical protein
MLNRSSLSGEKISKLSCPSPDHTKIQLELQEAFPQKYTKSPYQILCFKMTIRAPKHERKILVRDS